MYSIIEDNSIPEPNTGCWLWIRAYRRYYGHIRLKSIQGVRGKLMAAHRLSYTLYVGDIPNGMLVCHKCDNPACVNPDHLFLGTHKSNMEDMKAKGRGSPTGVRLTIAQMCEIKRLQGTGMSNRAIAAHLSIGRNQIARLA